MTLGVEFLFDNVIFERCQNTICYSQFYTRNRKKLVWSSKDNEKIKIWHHFQNVSIFCKKWRIPPFWNFFTKIGLENFKTAFWIITVVPSIELSTKKTKKKFPCNFEFPAPYIITKFASKMQLSSVIILSFEYLIVSHNISFDAELNALSHGIFSFIRINSRNEILVKISEKLMQMLC